MSQAGRCAAAGNGGAWLVFLVANGDGARCWSFTLQTSRRLAPSRPVWAPAAASNRAIGLQGDVRCADHRRTLGRQRCSKGAGRPGDSGLFAVSRWADGLGWHRRGEGCRAFGEP